MNKQTIITILLALAIVVGTSNALDFCIDHKDVAICAALAQRVLHALGQFQVALHVIGKVGGAHRRLLRFGYFPHLALRHFLVKLI